MSPTTAAAEPAVAIIVPVRNEADNIAPLVAEIAAAIEGQWPFEVIYVNDGSDDGTETELSRLMGVHPWLRQLRHARPCGKAAALRTGIAAARAPLVVTIDGDGENDPQYIPPLLQALIDGGPRVGLAAGQRANRRDGGFKKFQSRLANAVRRAVLRDGTRDTACGLKAVPRELFLALPFFDGLHRFLPALVRREGYEIVTVEVTDRPRLSGVSHYGLWDRLWVGILDLVVVWWLIRRRKHLPDVTEVSPNAG
jgi:dolichol-phosphate mannosyltransferase